MIFDGRWKQELKKLSWEISVWSVLPGFDEYKKHRLTRALLYSATILRKTVENEIEVEKTAKSQNLTLPAPIITSLTISALKYPYTDEEDWTLRGKICPSSYGTGQAVSLEVKNVCNWLLHSYVWSIASNAGQRGYSGFLVASDFDKEKFVHFVSFDEWKRVLTAAIEDSAL